MEEQSEPKRRVHNAGATGAVNHPLHYNTHPVCEAIDVVEHMSFNVGNAVKYLWRAGIKEKTPERQDLEKAAWYFRREHQRYTELTRLNLEGSDTLPSIAPHIVQLVAAVAKHPATSELMRNVLVNLSTAGVHGASTDFLKNRMNLCYEAIEKSLKELP